MPPSVVAGIPQEVQKVLPKLEPSDIPVILSFEAHSGGTDYFSDEVRIKAWRHLRDLGLVTEVSKEEVVQWNKDHPDNAVADKAGFRFDPLLSGRNYLR